MQKYLDSFIQMVSLRGLTDHTIKSYSTYLNAYLAYLKNVLHKNPEDVSWQEIYIMGVPAGDDIILMYQSSSYHDVAALRETSNKRPMREFEKRMEELGIMENGHLTKRAGDPSIFTQEVY